MNQLCTKVRLEWAFAFAFTRSFQLDFPSLSEVAPILTILSFVFEATSARFNLTRFSSSLDLAGENNTFSRDAVCTFSSLEQLKMGSSEQ